MIIFLFGDLPSSWKDRSRGNFGTGRGHADSSSQSTMTPKVRAAIQESDEVGTVLVRYGDHLGQKGGAAARTA